MSLENLIERREAQVKTEHESLVSAARGREEALQQEIRQKDAAHKRQVAEFEAEFEAVMAFKKRRDDVGGLFTVCVMQVDPSERLKARLVAKRLKALEHLGLQSTY